MRALGWVQFLADCASVVALFLLLNDTDPTQYRALAVGYVLTTGAQLVAAATLAYNYWTEVRARSCEPPGSPFVEKTLTFVRSQQLLILCGPCALRRGSRREPMA